jgi:hypothetical protein
VHRVELELRDPEADARRAGAIFQAFYRDIALRTCKRCGTIHPRP